MSWVWLLACASALSAIGCESIKQVGSECKGGVCPNATPISARACIASTVSAQLRVIGHPDPEIQKPHAVCLPRALPSDPAGRVGCRVLWTVGLVSDADVGETEPAPPWPVSCDEPFLQPAGHGHADNVCELKQLSTEQREDGEDGWYYDTSLGEGDAGPFEGFCSPGHQGISVTEGLKALSYVTENVSCPLTLALEDDELVPIDPDDCAPAAANAAETGSACMPSFVPGANGFDPREAWIETRSNDCDQGACLVFHLDGDPSPDCEPSEHKKCPTEREVEASVYCSCRCDAPEGDPGELCECGDGFSCEELLPDGAPGVRGSYCVRNAVISSEEEGGE